MTARAAALGLGVMVLVGLAGCADGPDRDPAALEAILADIEAGWENADGAPFERHFLDFPGARYIETGGQNEGLRDLVDNHVLPEGEVLESLEVDFTDTESHFEDGFAWTVSDVEVRATLREDGREIHRRGHQTVLYRWVDGRWRVVHTHSSTRPVDG